MIFEAYLLTDQLLNHDKINTAQEETFYQEIMLYHHKAVLHSYVAIHTARLVFSNITLPMNPMTQ